MPRRDRLFPALLGLLLLTLLGYIGFFAAEALRGEAPAAVCHRAVWEESLVLTGLLRREEVPITAALPRFRPTAEDGARVAAGSAVGIAYGTESDRRAGLLLAAGEARRTGDALSRAGLRVGASEAAAARTVRQLSAAVARGEWAEAVLWGESLRLRQTLLPDEENDPAALRTGPGEADDGPVRLIHAPESGLFAVGEAGYSPGDDPFGAPSPAVLRRLLSGMPKPLDPPLCGRIAGNLWCFTALTDAESAAALAVGGRVTLDLTALGGGTPEGECIALRPDEDDSVTAVFLCRRSGDALLRLRHAEIPVILARREGFAVPEDALWETDGGYFLQRITPLGTEALPVALLERRDGQALVASPLLREGCRVLRHTP